MEVEESASSAVRRQSKFRRRRAPRFVLKRIWNGKISAFSQYANHRRTGRPPRLALEARPDSAAIIFAAAWAGLTVFGFVWWQAGLWAAALACPSRSGSGWAGGWE